MTAGHGQNGCLFFLYSNFLQDITQDYREGGRIYLPQDEMRECGVGEEHIAEARTDAAMLRLIEIQIAHIRALLAAGAPLGWQLRGRLGLELRLILFGVYRMLDKLGAGRNDAFRRPRLNRWDWLALAWRSMTRRSP